MHGLHLTLGSLWLLSCFVYIAGLSDMMRLIGWLPCFVSDGKFKAVKLELSLRSSSYATMALREVLKSGTSAAYHTTLNVTWNRLCHLSATWCCRRSPEAPGSHVIFNELSCFWWYVPYDIQCMSLGFPFLVTDLIKKHILLKHCVSLCWWILNMIRKSGCW